MSRPTKFLKLSAIIILISTLVSCGDNNGISSSHRLQYQKLSIRIEACVKRIDIVNIAALVGLFMLVFFVGGGIAVWLLFTSKLPQPDYRMNTRNSLIFVAVCGVLFLLVFLLRQVLHPFFFGQFVNELGGPHYRRRYSIKERHSTICNTYRLGRQRLP